MNSRERLLKAIHHEEPDRIPIDLDSMGASGIAAMAYNRVKGYLSLRGGETRIWDPMLMLAIPEPEVLARFRVDTLPCRLPIPGLDPSRPAWKPWTLPDGSLGLVPDQFNPQQNENGDWVLLDGAGRITYRMPAEGFYFDQVYYPLAEATSVAEIEAFQIPLFTIEQLSSMHAEAKRVFEETDKAVVSRFRGSILEEACALRGWERFMMDLACEPKLVHAIAQKLTDYYLANLPGYMAAVGPYTQVIVVADDLGSQSAPFMSLKMYREMIRPYHRQIYAAIKSYYNHPLFLHCDGSIHNLIPDMIENGIEILNPVQITARDMDPRELKREFGKDLVFWGGGVDTQHILPYGTPEDVCRNVRELIEIFAPGGGFVFNQIHNIQAGIPPENIVAMFDAAYKYGMY
jgi:uroporphyrinogen decarboxylase